MIRSDAGIPIDVSVSQGDLLVFKLAGLEASCCDLLASKMVGLEASCCDLLTSGLVCFETFCWDLLDSSLHAFSIVSKAPSRSSGPRSTSTSWSSWLPWAVHFDFGSGCFS